MALTGHREGEGPVLEQDINVTELCKLGIHKPGKKFELPTGDKCRACLNCGKHLFFWVNLKNILKLAYLRLKIVFLRLELIHIVVGSLLIAVVYITSHDDDKQIKLDHVDSSGVAEATNNGDVSKKTWTHGLKSNHEVYLVETDTGQVLIHDPECTKCMDEIKK